MEKCPFLSHRLRIPNTSRVGAAEGDGFEGDVLWLGLSDELSQAECINTNPLRSFIFRFNSRHRNASAEGVLVWSSTLQIFYVWQMAYRDSPGNSMHWIELCYWGMVER